MKCSFFLFIFLSLNAFAKIEVQGHRGARWVRPENTLAAFEYALQIGVDTLELDLGVSKDHQLVVYHDQYINSSICLDKNGKKIKKKIPLNSLTLAEIKEFDCGTLINPRFREQLPSPGEKIPTLHEVFELVKNSKYPAAKTVRFNIEMKSEEDLPHLCPSPSEFAKLTLDVIALHRMTQRTVVQSFDHRTLVEAKKLNSQIQTSALLENRPKEKLTDLAERLKVNVISPHYEWLTQKDVQALHEKNVQVIPWTANNADSWKKLVSIGVDGIISDNPKALIEYLKNHM